MLGEAAAEPAASCNIFWAAASEPSFPESATCRAAERSSWTCLSALFCSLSQPTKNAAARIIAVARLQPADIGESPQGADGRLALAADFADGVIVQNARGTVKPNRREKQRGFCTTSDGRCVL